MRVNRACAFFVLAAFALACGTAAPPTPTVYLPGTPDSVASATPLPLPTPTPTPLPADRLAGAEQALHDGDFEAAAAAYVDLLSLSPEEEAAARARLGLGIARLRDGDHAGAVDALRDFVAAHPSDALVPVGRFMLGDALSGAGDPLAAAGEYRAYLSAGTVITAYVDQSLGNVLYAGGDYLAAADAYRSAAAAAPDASFEVWTREALALVYVALEDYDGALAQYDAILQVARIPAYRARIEHQAAETLLLAGESDSAYERHLSIVETYPEETYAYLSLVKLVEAGRGVDDYLRGLVDYYGGAYSPAVAAFARYVNASPSAHRGDAHWYAGLSFLAAGSPSLAEGEFRLLIDTHPGNALVGDAWMELAAAQVDRGERDEAIATYREFVDTLGGHSRAPEALWRVARLEEDGDLEAAAEAYLDCHARYTDSAYGAKALFRSGLLSYRAGAMVEAAVAWDTLARVYVDSDLRPAALLWLGKLRLAQGDPEAAASVLAEAGRSDPLGYYGLRAGDLLADPLSPLFSPAGYAPAQDGAAGRAETDGWLAGWLELESAAGLGDLGPDLAADPRLQRGADLWSLGRFEEAMSELEALRQATASDALAQYRLALYFRDLGLYRSSALCAVRLVDLSPAGTVLDAPALVGRLAYPVYYENLVLQSARENGLPPLLVFALVRQESFYESLATSHASAHGLMQVIPETGVLIAAQLGWPPGYETADLYRPFVSVRFGTYYLAQQRDRFGRIDAALAGYNGGPGNAQRWLELAGEDPDLFLEAITFEETRVYLQRIREHLAVYEALYGQRQ
jgi:soluble lytic murein transglycosylase